MATQDVKFIIAVEDQGAIRKLTETEQALYDLQKTTKNTSGVFSSIKGEFMRLAGSFATGQLIVEGMRKSFDFLKDTLVDSIKEAAVYEKAVTGLNAAFDLSGRTMPGMARNLQNYGEEMRKLGLADDAEVIKAESLLLQLTNLNENGIKAATRGAIGLSSVFGMDLFSATEMVAKGMEGNYLMLNRLIPAVRNATTEEGKRAAMMKTFEDLYKRAIADTQTYAGQVKALGLEWGEAKKALGESILSTGILQEEMAGLTHVIKVVSGLKKKEDKEATMEMIAANNKASASINEMIKRLQLDAHWAALTREQYHLSSVDLLDWIQAGMLGTQEMRTLNAVLKEQEAALAKDKQGFTETGNAAVKFAEQIKIAETALPKPFSTNQDVWKNQLGWLNQTTKTVTPELPKPFSTNQGAWKAQFEWLGVTAKKTTDKMSDYFAGFYNSIADGFANAFMQFRFSVEGFKDFFVGMWQTIKQAFFKVIGEMIAKWLVFKAIVGGLKLLGIPFTGGLSMAIPAANGFEGIVSGPTPFLVGEAGPERVSIQPLGTAGAMAGGGSMTINGPLVTINTTGLSTADIKRAGAEMLAEVKSQLRRVGRSI